MAIRVSVGPVVLAAIGAAFLVSSAAAQDASSYGDRTRDYGPNENVQVVAPRLHVESGRLNTTLETASMSQAVRYDDLDLRTPWGAHELRRRIRVAAGAICDQLDDIYPYKMAGSPHCYRAALDDAMVRADEAIDTARRYRD